MKKGVGRVSRFRPAHIENVYIKSESDAVMSDQDKPLALVVGAGPGLGRALLTHFGDQGYAAVGLARQSGQSSTGQEIIGVDLADPEATRATVKDILKAHGTPRVLIHNPAKLYIKPFEETTEAEFSTAWQSMVLSAFSVAQEVLPKMVEAGEGSYIVSGATASLRGGARFSAFASAKFALRGLTQSLAREYQTKGIHVAHIILDGIIDTEASRELHNLPTEKMMQTDALSQMYWDIAHQPRSVWTHELDLRPSTEGF